MNLSTLPLTLSASVQEKHLDELGHMNVMWYTHFFDLATWKFYESIDFGERYHQSGFGSFALEGHSRFLSELREDDQFSIFTRVLGRRDKVFHLMHFMQRDNDQKLSATLEALGVHIDMTTRKSSSMPEKIAANWDQIIAEHAALDWEAPLSGSLHT
jgi:acyl-CoA thioester hydrolase